MEEIVWIASVLTLFTSTKGQVYRGKSFAIIFLIDISLKYSFNCHEWRIIGRYFVPVLIEQKIRWYWTKARVWDIFLLIWRFIFNISKSTVSLDELGIYLYILVV